MSTTENQKPQYEYKAPKAKVPMYLIFLLVTLSVIVIILGIFFYQKNSELSKAKDDVSFIEEQKRSLEGELNQLIVGYDSLKTENDSINLKLEGEQDKIKKLLRINASNSQKIKLYQKELGTLREVMRSYIVQIDSLNTRNRELTEENILVRQELKQKESDYDELSQTTDQLSSKVEMAQKLIAKDIIAVGLNDRSREKDKVTKIAKIRVCFTIRENKVAESGKKMIYLRIVRPDNVVLSSKEAGLFDFQNESMIYSAKRELEYDNQDIDMCIFWDKIENLVPGSYKILLYCEGHEIGSSVLDLS